MTTLELYVYIKRNAAFTLSKLKNTKSDKNIILLKSIFKQHDI